MLQYAFNAQYLYYLPYRCNISLSLSQCVCGGKGVGNATVSDIWEGMGFFVCVACSEMHFFILFNVLLWW